MAWNYRTWISCKILSILIYINIYRSYAHDSLVNQAVMHAMGKRLRQTFKMTPRVCLTLLFGLSLIHFLWSPHGCTMRSSFLSSVFFLMKMRSQMCAHVYVCMYVCPCYVSQIFLFREFFFLIIRRIANQIWYAFVYVYVCVCWQTRRYFQFKKKVFEKILIFWTSGREICDHCVRLFALHAGGIFQSGSHWFFVVWQFWERSGRHS